MPIEPHPRLEEVQEAFARWRGECPRGHTPPTLRAQAVSLLSHYRISEVLRALKLDHRRLSRWRRERLSAPHVGSREEFVEVPPTVERSDKIGTGEPERLRLTLTHQDADGYSVSLAGELSAGQWRWVLGLLRESGR